MKTTSEQPVRTEPESMPTDADESPADVVLGKAEQQRDAVQAVSATVAVERIEPLFNKREVRTGALLYERTTDASPRFSVLLDKRLIGRRLESRTKHIVYDGRWLSRSITRSSSASAGNSAVTIRIRRGSTVGFRCPSGNHGTR